MTISEYIASIIEEMLSEGGGVTEVKRNDLATKLGCVPSQINYVITSRFTPERGYIIESKRGGGGYIRIVKKQFGKNDYLMHFFHAVGKEVSEREAAAYISNLCDAEIITQREEMLIMSALSSSALDSLSPEQKNRVRADILRHILLSLIY